MPKLRNVDNCRNLKGFQIPFCKSLTHKLSYKDLGKLIAVNIESSTKINPILC